MDKDIVEILDNIISGSAVCFLGSGFSRGATISSKKNVDGGLKNVPMSDEAKLILAKHLKINDEIKDESLSDIADLIKSTNPDEAKYIEIVTSFFLNNFTLCNPTEEQRIILSLPWRSIFTTNYDDIIERSSPLNKFEYFSPASENFDVSPNYRPVYHLHGRAADLKYSRSLEGFVLSETNYLELNKYNEKMYNRLFSDIHAASEVVFIGYSFRDVEIASRLFSIKSISRKVSIICHPDIRDMDKIRLKKFGTLFSIGVNKFSIDANEYNKSKKSTPSIKIAFLKKISINSGLKEINLEDFSRFILTGNFDYDAYMAQLNGIERDGDNFSDYYSVCRKNKIEQIFVDIRKGIYRNFLIAADVANGKSCFLRQLACHAIKYHGFDVYEVTTQLNEIFIDIDIVIKGERPSMFIVDGFARYKKVIEYIASRMGKKNVLIVTDPQTTDSYAGEKLFGDFSQRALSVDINRLDLDEIENWNKLLERWGLWEGRIQLDKNERINFLKKECSSENRSIILSIFKESNIANKIDALVSYFIANNEDHEQGLIALLIRALCHQHVEWSHIVSWLNLDDREIRKRVIDSKFLSLTEGERAWQEITSPELAGYILNKYRFNAEIIIDSYCRIVTGTANLSKDKRNGYDFQENLKELMRYRFLTRLFAKNENQESYINTVYGRLSKNSIIREKELFWLQWGMARLDLDDLGGAETYFKTASGLAAKYARDLSKMQIDDQFARLYFKKGTLKDCKVNDDEIMRAIKITSAAIKKRHEVLIHPMRTAVLINSFLEEKSDNISRSIICELIDLVREMLSLFGEKDLERAKKGESRQIKDALKNSLIILQNT